MGSTRLPGKVLEPIAGRPVLRHIVERLRAVPALEEVVVVTSVLRRRRRDRRALQRSSASVACAAASTTCSTDSTRAAGTFGAERIVRVTADCPLVDPEVIGGAARAWPPQTPGRRLRLGRDRRDRSPRSGYRRYPDGLDAETFTAEALASAWNEARRPVRARARYAVHLAPARALSRGRARGRAGSRRGALDDRLRRPISSWSGRSTTCSRMATRGRSASATCSRRWSASRGCALTSPTGRSLDRDRRLQIRPASPTAVMHTPIDRPCRPAPLARAVQRAQPVAGSARQATSGSSIGIGRLTPSPSQDLLRQHLAAG